MKRAIFKTIALVALALIAADMHNSSCEAQTLIKPNTPAQKLTLPWLAGVTLNKTTTVGGSVGGDITGTVRLLRPAISSLTISLTADGCLLDEAGILVANLPANTITIPAGSDNGTFRIQTLSSPNTTTSITCKVTAHYGDEQKSAGFTVTPLLIASFDFVPAGGVGPFSATGSMAMNAQPLANRTVTVTSSNPVVRFGSAGNAQPSASVIFNSTTSMRAVSVVAGAVTVPTTVTITATNGAQTLTRQITIRPAT